MLSRKVIIFGVIVFIIASALFIYFKYSSEKQIVVEYDNDSYKNATYIIQERYVTLTNGINSYAPASESAFESITRIFGNEVRGDFNNDGISDIAFILTRETGGSGTFFYITAALGTTGGDYTGLNAIFLGDRIAPQTTEFRNGEIIVNFAVRKEGEPMTARPSEGVSRYFKVRENTLFELPNKV